MTTLTSRQIVDSRLLMILLSGSRAQRGKLMDKVLATVADQSDGEKSYNVEVRVNGIELDFADFTDEVQRQIDEMVMGAARKLLDEQFADRFRAISEQCYEAEHAAKDLRNAMEAEARKAWGLPPRQSEDQ